MTDHDPALPRIYAPVPAESFGRAFGQIKTFNIERGCGFIRTTHDVEAFLRMRDLLSAFEDFKPGDLVEFTLYRGERGWFAREVARVANDPVVFWAWRKLETLRW